MFNLPSLAGVEVTLLSQGSGSSKFFYYTTPFGVTRSFGTKALARKFARQKGWKLVDKSK